MFFLLQYFASLSLELNTAYDIEPEVYHRSLLVFTIIIEMKVVKQASDLTL